MSVQIECCLYKLITYNMKESFFWLSCKSAKMLMLFGNITVGGKKKIQTFVVGCIPVLERGKENLHISSM